MNLEARLHAATDAQRSGRLEEAERLLRDLLAGAPDHPGARAQLGLLLVQRGRPQDGVRLIEETIAFAPNAPAGYLSRGHVSAMTGQFPAALADYERALALAPGLVEAHFNRGGIFAMLGRMDQAVASFDAATRLAPDFADAHAKRGAALQVLGQSAEALASFDRALALAPNEAALYFSRAVALRALERLDEALEALDRAIGIAPNYAEAHAQRGGILNALERWDEALASLERAAKLNPDADFVLGELAHRKLHLCDWGGLDVLVAQIKTGLDAGAVTVQPFAALSLPTTPTQQQRAAQAVVRALYPPRASVLAPYRHGRIRLAYVSPDLNEHAVGYLMAELIEKHDRALFEVVGISLSPPTKDATHARLRGAFDQFADAAALTDQQIALTMREMQIDIAVDLAGHTQGGRPRVFSYRAAPVQAAYLYPGTMGAPYYDYVIADRVLIPEAARAAFNEKIVALPDCYMVSDTRRPISSAPVRRAELGLPDDALVFCAFNSAYKHSPEMFDIWMRILRTVDRSVLWLKVGNTRAEENLRREAQARGVAAERLVFAKGLPLDQHLARHRAADLFLDSFPYTAHTTANDALYAGLPVLTRAGDTYVSRVGASLLKAIGLEALIAGSAEDYERIALDLARNRQKLTALKERLAANRMTHPLFDTERFARQIEDAYAAMHKRALAGLAPDHIDIL